MSLLYIHCELKMCITEVIELMTLQEIPNMAKDNQLSLYMNKKKI